MKKFIILLLFTFGYVQKVIGQVPEQFSYQAVVRDSNNSLVINQKIAIRISILSDSLNGPEKYIELHETNTSSNGVMSIEVGNGYVEHGVFSSLDWSSGNHYIRSKVDISGGNNYEISGTSALLSVPYALHAKTATSILNKDNTYKVGDLAFGGVVYWMDESGQHGLVCSMEDLGESVWARMTEEFQDPSEPDYYHVYIGARGNGIFGGKMNTLLIAQSQIASFGLYAECAAIQCSILEVGINDTKYGDWYLPSSVELELIYKNIDLVNSTIRAIAFKKGQALMMCG